jgi:hypothetical protein
MHQELWIQTQDLQTSLSSSTNNLPALAFAVQSLLVDLVCEDPYTLEEQLDPIITLTNELYTSLSDDYHRYRGHIWPSILPINHLYLEIETLVLNLHEYFKIQPITDGVIQRNWASSMETLLKVRRGIAQINACTE